MSLKDIINLKALNLQKLLSKHKSLLQILHGTSMLPSISNYQLVEMKELNHKPKAGNVYFAINPVSSRLFCHRAISVTNKGIVFKGDNEETTVIAPIHLVVGQVQFTNHQKKICREYKIVKNEWIFNKISKNSFCAIHALKGSESIVSKQQLEGLVGNLETHPSSKEIKLLTKTEEWCHISTIADWSFSTFFDLTNHTVRFRLLKNHIKNHPYQIGLKYQKDLSIRKLQYLGFYQ